jgi:hypothetical protein
MNETQVLVIGTGNPLRHRNSSGIPIDTGHPLLKPAMAQVIQQNSYAAAKIQDR